VTITHYVCEREGGEHEPRQKRKYFICTARMNTAYRIVATPRYATIPKCFIDIVRADAGRAGRGRRYVKRRGVRGGGEGGV
jgi:hypothetical protein